jgi:hypothetical protein
MASVSISCLHDIYCCDYKRYSRLNLLEDGTKEIELDNKEVSLNSQLTVYGRIKTELSKISSVYIRNIKIWAGRRKFIKCLASLRQGIVRSLR